jgi:hypothetical protein
MPSVSTPNKPATMLISKSDRKKVYKYLFEGALRCR